MWFVFNELSVRVCAATRREGGRRMDGLVDAVASVMNGRTGTLLSIEEDGFWGAELAPGHTVTHWWTTADRDRKLLLRRIATKIGFPDEASEALRNRFFLSEFLLLDAADSERRFDARGLGAAFLLDGIAVSLPSEDRWAKTWIPLRHVWCDEDIDEREEDVNVLNLSEPGQVEGVSDILFQRSQGDLQHSPSALTARRSESFPHLSFGLDVDRQVGKLPSTSVPAVVSKLLTLDDASRAWRRHPEMLSPKLPKCHPETEPTMQQYGDRRVFRDPRGRQQTYSLHAMVGSAYRIHMRIIHDPRGVEIGYVGKHLPTKTFD